MENWKEKAEKWFGLHTELSNTFDSRLANYYSNDAYLQNTLILENGEQKHRVVPAAIYKSSIERFIGIAKDRGDSYDISDVQYELDNNRVVVRYVRHSHVTGISSPVKVIIGLEGEEEGLILAEYSVSTR